MDFTLTIYQEFLINLLKRNYKFLTFADYILQNSHTENSKNIIDNFQASKKQIILRHDIDRLPRNALQMANIEFNLGIKGTYYFRIVPQSYNPNIIEKIINLGHEVGYHYEDIDLIFSNQRSAIIDKNGNINEEKLIDLAYENFCMNLEMLRKNFNIKTICMHGSPRSKFDNKLIWTKYDYRKLGLWGEPYFDIDFNEFAYFTDTGRRWNGYNVSIRDRVKSSFNFNFKSTIEIIENIDLLPDKVMFTIHPERWHNNPILWTKELLWQNTKNIIKKMVVIKNSKS